MLLDQIEDRHERGGSKPDLIGQRRGRQRDAFACEPGALAIERTVHAELVEQDRRQQMRADEAARRGMERRRRLADRLTVPAAVLLPTVSITLNRRGISSGVSVMSSPSFAVREPPQQAG